MLLRFFSCRERFRLKYVLGLEPHDKWHHTFGYGNMWHVCEEALAKSSTLIHNWSVALERHLAEQSARHPLQREELWKWFNVAKVQFPEYVKFWEEHPDVRGRTPLFQEQVFDIQYPLVSGRRVRLRGKWDSVDFIPAHTDADGKQWPDGIWLQENKTKGDIDKLQVERQLTFDLQTMMYLIALEEFQKERDFFDADSSEAELFCHNPILGVRYNVVRRPLSSGKGSIKPHQAKSTKTKFTPAETEEQFYERLRRDYIAAEPDYWFFRVKVGVEPHDVAVFRQTCMDPLLEHLCRWYDDITGRPFVSITNGTPTSYMNYRTPFGVYSALEEGGATEYDAYMATGNDAGLRRVTELFTELKS